MTRRLSRKTLREDTIAGAKSLLGTLISTTVNGQRTSGMIVEVEAYCGADDEAAHSYRGITPRCEIMFGEAGFCYVYFTYGMHHCVNVVTREKGLGEAVLIRAIEPIEGIEIMKKRRKNPKRAIELTNGPGKVCQALSIDRKHYGEDFITSEKISITNYKKIKPQEIASSTRIGISKARENAWRFFLRGNVFVSRRPSN